MRKSNRNIRVLAVNAGRKSGFHIFLDFSGRQEYLMTHRHNALLFWLLKDGMALDDIRRWRPSHLYRGKNGVARRGSGSVCLDNMVRHLILVIDAYLLDRAAC